MISKTPELHSHDLENSAARQLPSTQSLRFVSHFSSKNYGYYCLFF